MSLSLVSTGRRRSLDGAAGRAFTILAAGFAGWVIYANLFVISDPLVQGILFVSGILTLLFPVVGHSANAAPQPGRLDWLLSGLSLVTGVYFFLTSASIQERIPILDPLTVPQYVFGAALLALVIEATRRTTGLGLTGVVILFLAYNWFGYLLPPPFGHGVSEFSYLLEALVFSTDGLFGVPIQVVASYVFLFVLFGTLLARAGGDVLFFNLAATATGKSAGGPAKVAVISSGLYGTVSGSPTSDVVTTGSITIPMMKRLGYPSRFAGAVEVAASTGGSAMPPILGSAAFILAEFTQTPYQDIVLATILPALIYYVGVYAQVHLRSARDNMRPIEGDVPGLGATLRGGWMFFVPIATIIGMLWVGYSPVMTAGVGCLAVVLGAALTGRTRLSLWSLIDSLGQTTVRILPVAAACAAAGLVIGGLSMTGLGMKSAGLIASVADGMPGWTLVLAAGVTILLGLGMPTPSAYILAAVLVGPALVDVGLPLLESHLFLLYFAILSALTPPIAVAAMAAAAIADEDPFRIAFDAVRLASVGFVLPFAFLWNPALLGQGSVVEVLYAGVCGVGAAGGVAMALELAWGERARWQVLLFRAGLLGAAVAAIAPVPLVSAVGVFIIVAISTLRWRQRAPALKVLPLDDPAADDWIAKTFGHSPILIQFPTVFAIFAPATRDGAALLDTCKNRLPGKYYTVIPGDPAAFFALAPDLPLSRYLLADGHRNRLTDFVQDMEGAFLRLPVGATDQTDTVLCNGQLQALFVGGVLQRKMRLMEQLSAPMEGKIFGPAFGGYAAPIGSSCNMSGDPAGSITDPDAALAFAIKRGIRLCLTQPSARGAGSGPIFGLDGDQITILRDGPGMRDKQDKLRRWIERSAGFAVTRS